MPRSPEQQRVKALEYYYRVRQKKERRVPGGQGGRSGLIPMDERAAFLFLGKLDRHIEWVDCQRITEFMKDAWYRRKLDGKRKSTRARKEERDAQRAAIKEERQHSLNIRRFFCRKCGNHRAFIPDTRGKCSACQRRKRIAYKQRAQASGKWGVHLRLAKHRRRSRIRANGGAGTVTIADWQWVLDRYGAACLCCGSNAPPTIDHVVPLSLGGPHDKTNLQPLCALCNSLKNATVVDYRFDRPLAPMARDPNVVRYVPGTD